MRSGRGSVWLVMAGALLAGAGLVAAGRGPLASPPRPRMGRGGHLVRAGGSRSGGPHRAAAGRRPRQPGGSSSPPCSSSSVARPAVAFVQTVADGVSPRWLTRLAHGAAGLAVTVGLAGPPVPSDPAGTAVMEVLEEPGSATSTTTTPTTTTTTTPTTTTPSAPPPRTPPKVPDAPPPPIAAEEVVVARGDSFWSLAVEAVAESSRPASVDAYWRRLVELNRPRLVDPANPDLLYPGQVLVLPPIALT